MVYYPLYNFIMALAIIDVTAEYTLSAYLKWPNDVMVQGRKISGILSSHHQRKLIVGVGFNLRLEPEQMAAIAKPAVSLYELTDARPDRNRILERILFYFKQRIHILEDYQTDRLVSLFQQVGYKLDDMVRIHVGHEIKRIRIKGINPMGRLLAEDEQGHSIEIISGELIDE